MALKKCAEFGAQPVTALGRGGVKVEKRQHIVTSSWRIELHVLIDAFCASLNLISFVFI
jgi:hypothetical protein